ncbi:hypothetical protein [Planktothrix mougeotii]|uniref:Uncharacterized protein n=1 Tax=Planktothrix mougeotii LEGE 06226 TaxID=1828728 RepID=A0ABR9U7G3_9CYAN|nr:hypothetical protein [Planktothrix mougeotii]MBE9142398.1 hypothetical protein [Planktothrix mougeotii LEGE 06226]
MNFLINELSFIGQATNIYDADTLMKALAEVIKAIKPILGNDSIYIHELFSNCKITENYTVKDWVYEKSLSNDHDQVQALLLIKLFTDGPFILDILNQELLYWECEFNGEDYCESSLAGAAYLQGILISLQQAPDFSSELINVLFKLDENPSEIIEVYNLINADQVKNIPGHYLPPNPQREIYDGNDLWNRKDQLFSHLQFCKTGTKQLRILGSGEAKLKWVLKTLEQLEEYTEIWISQGCKEFSLEGYSLDVSGESKRTLDKYWKERTFLCPDGEERLFDQHIKLKQCNWRIHFFLERKTEKVIIGYVGVHLPTVKYST